MSEKQLVEVSVNPNGRGEVKINGEVVKGLSGIDLKIRAGEATEIILHLPSHAVVVRCETEADKVRSV